MQDCPTNEQGLQTAIENGDLVAVNRYFETTATCENESNGRTLLGCVDDSQMCDIHPADIICGRGPENVNRGSHQKMLNRKKYGEVDVKAVDNDGHTAIALARVNNHEQIEQYLAPYNGIEGAATLALCGDKNRTITLRDEKSLAGSSGGTALTSLLTNDTDTIYTDPSILDILDEDQTLLTTVLRKRNQLCIDRMYSLSTANFAKRRVQEMLLAFIEDYNKGRFVQRVRGHPGYFHVVSEKKMLSIMGKMLYEGSDHLSVVVRQPLLQANMPDESDDDSLIREYQFDRKPILSGRGVCTLSPYNQLLVEETRRRQPAYFELKKTLEKHELALDLVHWAEAQGWEFVVRNDDGRFGLTPSTSNDAKKKTREKVSRQLRERPRVRNVVYDRITPK